MHTSSELDAAFALPNERGCRLWTKGTRGGYGWVNWRGRSTQAHRVVWELAFGRSLVCVLHHCDEPLCGELSHLFEGTRADNNRDRNSKNRQALKYPDGLVRELRELRSHGETYVHLGRRFGIHPKYVSDLVSGKRRAEVA